MTNNAPSFEFLWSALQNNRLFLGLFCICVIIISTLVIYAVLQGRPVEVWSLKIGPSRKNRIDKNPTAVPPGGDQAMSPSDNKVAIHLMGNGAFPILDGKGSHPVGRIIHSNEQRKALLSQIVNDAEKYIYCTGSRSWDKPYMDAIEARLKRIPHLVYCRILFGHPHHDVLKKHLVNVLEFRDPADRSFDHPTVQIALLEDSFLEPECFICANEKIAFIKLPSLEKPHEYDTGVVYEDPHFVERMKNYVHVLAQAGKQIDSIELVKQLMVLRAGSKKSSGV